MKTEEEINYQLQTESDPDKIFELLDELESLGENDGDHDTGTSPGTQDQSTDTDSAKPAVPEQDSATQGADASEQQQPPGGQQPHQQEEEHAPEVSAEALELQQKLDELEARNALFLQQLQENKIEPGRLPHEISVTDQDLAELKAEIEEVGPTGKVAHDTVLHVRRLEAQVLAMQEKQEKMADPGQSAAQPAENVDGQALIRSVAGLPDIMANPVLRQKALEEDAKLMADPKYADKPDQERLAEVVRLVRKQLVPPSNPKDPTMTGEPAPYSIEEASGQGADADHSLANKLNAMDGADAQRAAEGLSDAELDRLFSEM
ncbi:hypothetical protein [Pseudoalteromonas rubra]|uniref:hypothetical protein n=1 Tax=Pseudoalteromonas rubra TaxID=43658 RepID=UPI002DBD6B0E|nr:hypothetical protein [Pseudoalteromonas rubra]MEC4091589.1 hypothetical protein [Pseudoalteromonas rubra]